MISASMMGKASQASLELLQIQVNQSQRGHPVHSMDGAISKAGSVDVSEESLLKAQEMMAC